MSAFLPSHDSEASTPSLHPALFGTETLPGSVPTILVCPLPLPGLPHEQLLPELSHELKTPLTGIMGLAQVLQRYPNPIADRERQYAELIYQKSQQLLVSINDLFDLAQLCTHQFVLQLRPLELFSVVKTALKVAQYTTDSKMPAVEPRADSPDDSELWMMGDLPRLEQLLTHLIGYFSVQGAPESHPVLKLRTSDAQLSQGSWISITLIGTLREESAQAQDRQLRWPHPPLDLGASAMPGRNGAVLKFLLAKQLAQLHGGDVSWMIRQSLETEVTVLLPRDLTRATVLTRPGSANPVFLIYAQPNAEINDVVHLLQGQGVLVAIGRSPDEIQEKIKILSPAALVLNSGCVEAPEWPALMTWLTEHSTRTPVHLIWLKTPPIRENNSPLNTLDVWPLPLTAARIAQTLGQIRQNAEQVRSPQATIDSSAKGVRSLHQSSHSLVVLQLDPVSPVRPPAAIFMELLTCLSRDFGCSFLAADDPEQAELLSQIWKPRAMICTESAPKWAMHFSQPSGLAELPLFLLCLEERKPQQRSEGNHCRVFPVDRQVSIQNVAQHLYQALTAVT
jgi:His Kinase A (phospho-acceptor) domain